MSRIAAALLHDLALFGTLAAHFLGIGDQGTVNLDAILVAQQRVAFCQLAENAQLELR